MKDHEAREAAMLATFVELTSILVDEFDVVDMLTHLADRCVELLDVDAAGMMLATSKGSLRAVASSSEAAHTLELFELQAEQGPCYECFHTSNPLANVSLTDAVGRWPEFAPRALAAGFRSASAIPMRVGRTTIGAMNLFRCEPAELGPADLVAAGAFAHVATIGILQYRAVDAVQLVNDQLGAALESRVLVEQAKGMLAERAGLDMDEAFACLRTHARNHNLRLSEVAGSFVAGNVTVDELKLGAPKPRRQRRSL